MKIQLHVRYVMRDGEHVWEEDLTHITALYHRLQNWRSVGCREGTVITEVRIVITDWPTFKPKK